MKIDINLIKELRNATFAPMGDCKSALEAAEGDLQKAIEILREKGIAKAGKKADRETNEGMVKAETRNDKTVVLKMLCETDFVMKNERFQELFSSIVDRLFTVDGNINSFEELPSDLQAELTETVAEFIGKIGENIKIAGVVITTEKVYGYNHMGNKVTSLVYYSGDENIAKEIALQVAAMNPTYLSLDEVPEDQKNELRAQFTEEMRKAGKPENMIANIVESKIVKSFAEDVLLEQESIRDGSKKVKDLITGDFSIKKFERFSI